MKVSELLKKYSFLEIDLLLAHVLHKPKEFLYLNPKVNLTTKQYNDLKKLIRRRKKGEPIAYILGYKYFYGLRFKVTKDTLVPRPETELIVDIALDRIKNKELRIKNLLDVGTGSGCIAVTLAKHSKAKIIASDISQKALAVARMNAKNNKASVKFVLSDLLDQLDLSPDLIIANLPYVSKKDKRSLAIDLKFEPKVALFTKDNGLYEISRFLLQIKKLKTKPKFILLEFDPRQKPALAKLIKKTLPEGSVKFYKDLGGLWRVVEVFLP